MGSFAASTAKENQANNIGSSGAQTNYNFSDLTLAGWGSSNASSFGGASVGGAAGGGAGGATGGQDLFNNTGIILNSSDLGAIEYASELMQSGIDFVGDSFGKLLESQQQTLRNTSTTLESVTRQATEVARGGGVDMQKLVYIGAGIFALVAAMPLLKGFFK